MDNAQLNHFSKLQYKDPEWWLVELSKIETETANHPMDPKVRALRTNQLKLVKETREAALFCHGMSLVTGNKILFTRVEELDYDAVATWIQGDTAHYSPIQLKELVPEQYNPQQTLNKLLQDIAAKYPVSTELTVAVFVNRQTVIDFTQIKVPETKLHGIWLYGCSSQDQQTWFIYGNLVDNPSAFQFNYPQA